MLERSAAAAYVVAGHSDGDVIAFGVGFLECCRDPRVRAVVAMAGNLANANNPHVRDTGWWGIGGEEGRVSRGR
jgi:hypothetical protein